MEPKERYAIVTGLTGLALGIGGWGASMSGYVNPPLGITLMAIGALVFSGAVVWGLLPMLGRFLRLRANRKATVPEVLKISSTLSTLSLSYPEHSSRDMITTGYLKRVYLLLRVCNEGNRDLLRVVARCSIAGSNEVLPCFWSKETGPQFVPEGMNSADLHIWQDRLLVIVQAFGSEKLWARLPENQKHLFLVPSLRDRPFQGRAFATSRAGEDLDLGQTIELIVRFRGEGFEEERRLLLGFDSEDPTISITPSGDPGRSRPSG